MNRPATHVQHVAGEARPGPAAASVRLVRCVEACHHAAQACAFCADACLAEADPEPLIRCAQRAMDCADLCFATGQVAARRTDGADEVLARLIAVCAEACRVAAHECERHAGRHGPCRDCAEACRACERACREVLQAVTA
jgi:hypothetical protein